MGQEWDCGWQCGGESAAYPADISQYDSPKNPKIMGKVRTTRKVWMNVGNKDVSGRLLVGTVPVSMQNSGRIVTKCAKKAENMSPNLKRNLKLISSNSGRKFGTGMLGMGSPQTRTKSPLGGGKLSKTENIKLKEKIKLFEIFQRGIKTIRK